LIHTRGSRVRFWPPQEKFKDFRAKNVVHHSICFSSDNKILVTSSIETLLMWDILQNKEIDRLSKGGEFFSRISFLSNDNNTLLELQHPLYSENKIKAIKIWDLVKKVCTELK
jgi:WD40 repeat protein